MTTTYINDYIATADLQLGDVVQLWEGPWATAIVSQVTDDEVTFFRPYGKSDDFSYAGGVICYTGLESYKLLKKIGKVYVYERKGMR